MWMMKNFTFLFYFPFVSHILQNENIEFCILTHIKELLGEVELTGNLEEIYPIVL